MAKMPTNLIQNLMKRHRIEKNIMHNIKKKREQRKLKMRIDKFRHDMESEIKHRINKSK
jgi:hypothetical protein